MSVQRTPPGSQERLNIPIGTPIQYASDPALNTTNTTDLEDNFLNITKRQKRTFGEFSGQSSTVFSEIKSMIAELKVQQDSKFESLNSTLLTIMSQNQEIHKSVENLKNQHNSMLSKIISLESQNAEGKKKILELESQLDIVDKKQRCTSIEIRNLPKLVSESEKDLTKIIQSLVMLLDSEKPVSESEIREVYRNKAGTIVVDFTTVIRKKSIISKFKNFNKIRLTNSEAPLNSEQLKLAGPCKTIFISENLSAKTRRLFYLAREKVKSKQLHAAWTSFGKVYVKSNEGAKPTCIQDESEFDKII